MGRLGLDVRGSLRRSGPMLALGAIVAVGAGLRFTALGRHFFWFDEGLLLDIDELKKGLVGYIVRIWGETTYNPGWAALLWFVNRFGGDSIRMARLPSSIAGILAIGMVFSAARAMKLDRPTALMAALLTALTWPQVEYSQQILPYAGIPLFTALIVWCLARIGRSDPERAPLRHAGWHYLLGVICIADVVNHNSFLMLIPFLGFCLFWILARRPLNGESIRGLLVRMAGRLLSPAALTAFVTFATVVCVSIVFFLPKSGEGYRTYLDPYYLSTFRGHEMEYGPFTDGAYLRAVPRSRAALDLLYFGASRAYDTFLYGVNLFSPTYVDTPWGIASAVPVGLALAGLVLAVRGKRGPVVQAVALGLVLTMLILFGLSTVKQYPFGGIRQLIFLSPLVILLAAVGWRSTLRRWPAPTWAGTALCLFLYAVRVPVYYQETASRMSERDLKQAIRETGIRTLVAPEFGEHYFVLNHALRKVPNHQLLDVTWPQFGALTAQHQPFLLYSKAPITAAVLAGEGTSRHELVQKLKSKGLSLRDYEYTPIITYFGGPFRGGQPNQGVYLYAMRPKPAPPAVASRVDAR